MRRLVVIASGHDLFASGSQHDGVLELGSVATFTVTQWRVRVHNTLVAQILQCHLVLGRTGAVQPTFTESQCTEVLVYRTEKSLGRLQTTNETYNKYKYII